MLSYAKGPTTPLLEITVDEGFRQTVRAHGDRPALVVRHQNRRLSWRELDFEVERLARGLAGLGITAGDRIGVWSTNNLEWILLQLGAARLGAVLVNVNPAYRSHELRYILERSGMRALFLRERDQRSNYRQILETALESASTARYERAVYFDHESWQRMLDEGCDYRPPSSRCHDVANIQYTSGTTGSPKGVLLTHSNLVNNAHLVARRMRIREDDVVCSPVPLYHCFGCVMSSLLSFLTGATLVLPAATFNAEATLMAASEERATAIYGVPTMFIAELQHPDFDNFELDSLRTGIMAGAPCPIEIMRQVISRMHCREITIAYGQTESSPVITQSLAEDELEHRVSTVGCAMENTEVRIIGADGEVVPAGEIGELCTRGYLVMKGYDGNPSATAEAVDSEGWLHTGDLAVMFPDGYFGIRGRARDMIIRGGENVYPREVEEFLFTHPSVSDAAVFGLPDERLGEVVCAWIRLKPGAAATPDEIAEFCRGRIAHFKVPQHVRLVEEFPMTVTGKLQKFRMREQEIALRGLDRAAGIRTA